MSAFRAALRISRRDALRFKGRTALIMIMICLPVLTITAVLTMVETTSLTPREELPSQLGPVADARIMTHYRRGFVRQDPAGRFGDQDQTGNRPPPWTTAEVNALLPGRLLPIQKYTAPLVLPDGHDQVDVLEVDLRDPLATGIRPLAQGRIPATADEVAVTPGVLDLGIRLGGTLNIARRDKPLRVVGVVEHPNRPGITELVGQHGSILRDKSDGVGTGWLIDTPSPVLWPDVRRLNQAGLRVASRAVIESPRTDQYAYNRTNGDMQIAIAIAVVLIVTETTLLAGPAFAVGLRRRRRELATIAAQGGSARHLRTIVLADGLVLGGLAAVIGVVLGIGAGAATEALLARRLDWLSAPPDVPWVSVLGVAVLGLVSALAAALVPAVQAARQNPAQVLAGRPGEARDRASRPVLGLVLVVLGLGATAVAVRGREVTVVAASTVVLFGLIALMPWLVRFTGRLARRLPLPARLSVRDAARHRVRTASAAAAVMAATMAAVTAGIAYNSEAMRRDANMHLDMPPGSLSVGAHDLDDAGWAALRAEVQKRLPGVSLVPALTATDAAGRSLMLHAVSSSQNGKVNCDECGLTAYDVAIGDARLLAFLQGRQDPGAAAALAAGKAVAFDSRLVRDGKVTLAAERWRDGQSGPSRLTDVPAVVATGADDRQGSLLLPASAVTAVGLKTTERRLYAGHVAADFLRLERGLRAVTDKAVINVAPTYDGELVVLLSAALLAALVLVLGGTFAATGLAAADMRADLDTLSAVGGRPRTRKLVVAAQAGYIAGLGAVPGLLGGIVAGIAVTVPMPSFGSAQGVGIEIGPTTVAVPWLFLAALVVGLPLLAALLAGLFTRMRPTLARRVV
ncbi:FtsX-like permease family protein [Nonomuraea sp. NPDC046802]|uniref:FtsX-like permease family protein n=1 Tax=Nonomuraea sp. NPDC046802 TaxID=3154919 RepID=UPI0034008029